MVPFRHVIALMQHLMFVLFVSRTLFGKVQSCMTSQETSHLNAHEKEDCRGVDEVLGHSHGLSGPS